MPWLEPVTLRGAHARLEPLSQDHCDGLTEAVKDGELWKLWYTSVPSAEGMLKEIDRRLGLQAAGSMLPWTVFDASGKIAGMTTYMNVDTPNRHRTPRRQAGRHFAQPLDRADRHVARYGRLQHYRQRMADGEGASQLSTQRKGAVDSWAALETIRWKRSIM
jgi:hypothetical protein